MTVTTPADQATGAATDRRRWWALTIIAMAQLMVVLDATVVNIALPEAQRDLGISDADRQWVVTAYALAFGGLLLLGGRIADYWGRKRTFLVGVVGFALASALGGAAQNAAMLFGARALQGVFGALLAPAALALLQVTFTEGRERAKAFGVYGAIAAGGSAVGLVLGGVLTEYLNWRWCLLVNLPVAVVAVAATVPLLSESRAEGNTKYDVPGAVAVSAGLAALVFGFTKAAENGWSSATTLGFIAGGVALLVAFVVIESRSRHPLLPLRIPLDSARGGAYLASLLGGAALLGGLLFLTYYFQVSLGYSPVISGVAALPLTGAVLVSAAVATQLLPRVGPRLLMGTGAVITAAGMAYLTRIGLDTSYVTHVLPSTILIGAGLGLLFVPLQNTALVGVEDHDAGAASALVNATQQVGGSLGTALFNTFYATAVTGYLGSHTPSAATQAQSLIHGYTTAFWYAAGLMLIAALVAFTLIRVRREDLPAEGALPA